MFIVFYDRDIYIISCSNVISNDGLKMADTYGTSLHKFCEEWIDKSITSSISSGINIISLEGRKSKEIYKEDKL